MRKPKREPKSSRSEKVPPRNAPPKARSPRASTARFRASAAGRVTDPTREETAARLRDPDRNRVLVILGHARDELNQIGSRALVAPLVWLLDELVNVLARGDDPSIEAEGGPVYWARARKGQPLNRAHAAYTFVALVKYCLQELGGEPGADVLDRLKKPGWAKWLVTKCGLWLEATGVEYGLCIPFNPEAHARMIEHVQVVARRQIGGRLDAHAFAVAMLVGTGVERDRAHTVLRPARDGDLAADVDFLEKL
jgi:hypothetical protein